MKFKLQRKYSYGKYYEFETSIKPEHCFSKKDMSKIYTELNRTAKIAKSWEEIVVLDSYLFR